MTQKELKRLNRRQLLELLITQTERADRMEARVNELELELENKELRVAEAGSIAEASLRLNGVFEAAEAAAEQYLVSIRNQATICQQMEDESRKKADEMLAEAERKCSERELQAEEKVKHISDTLKQWSKLFQDMMVSQDDEK